MFWGQGLDEEGQESANDVRLAHGKTKSKECGWLSVEGLSDGEWFQETKPAEGTGRA